MKKEFADIQQYKEEATSVLEKVLSAMHKKNYCKVLGFFDDTEYNDMDEIQELVESRAYDSVDEYGTPCDFNPSYEYSQLEFYDYTDGSGFRLEYDLTTDCELMDLSLQMEFIYTENGLKKRFLTVDSR